MRKLQVQTLPVRAALVASPCRKVPLAVAVVETIVVSHFVEAVVVEGGEGSCGRRASESSGVTDGGVEPLVRSPATERDGALEGLQRAWDPCRWGVPNRETKSSPGVDCRNSSGMPTAAISS